MVYTVHFPSELTEEERRLKEAFEKLRKMKKLYQTVKSRKTEDVVATKVRPSFKSSFSGVDATGATEQAKQLVKSGGVTIQKVEEKHSFKRSNMQQKRLKEDGVDSDKKRSSLFGPPETSYGSANERRFENKTDSVGNTIYVRSVDLREDTLTRAFSAFGKIMDLHIDDRRRSANITFETPQHADRAITEMNGNMLNGITLQVSMARQRTTGPALVPTSFHPQQRFQSAGKQRFDRPQNSNNSNSRSSVWSDAASRPGSHSTLPTKRDIVKYGDDD